MSALVSNRIVDGLVTFAQGHCLMPAGAEAADTAGRMLLAVNLRSLIALGARTPESLSADRTRIAAYRHRRVELERLEILTAVRDYDYLACEAADYLGSDAARAILAIARAAALGPHPAFRDGLAA